MKAVVSTLAIFALSAGCGNLNDKIKEQEYIKGKAQVDANNADLARKSRLLEGDLEIRQRFFQGVSGTYFGNFQRSGTRFSNMNVRIIISPNIHPVPLDRVRTPEEITADITGLRLNVEVMQSNPDDQGTFGCNFAGVVPNLSTGEIHPVANECPNAFVITLGGESELGVSALSKDLSPRLLIETSSNLAKTLLIGSSTSVRALSVIVNATRTAEVSRFFAHRRER